MCLIIVGKAQKIRDTLLETDGMLQEICRSNPNGIGVMYNTTRGLRVKKVLPKDLDEATVFIRRIPRDDRDFAIHFRYTTHGDNDLLNCHPYTVLPGKVVMMHNGVLRTGNDKDRSKSDTWHFIEDFLVEPLSHAPSLLGMGSFQTLVEGFIGSNNKFVLLDDAGNMVVLNRSAGIEHDGMWFSNTYAWKPSMLIKDYYKTQYGGSYYGYQGNYGTTYGKGATYVAVGGSPSPKVNVASGDASFELNGYEGMDEYEDFYSTVPEIPRPVSVPNVSAHSVNWKDDDAADAEWDAAVKAAHVEWVKETEEAAMANRVIQSLEPTDLIEIVDDANVHILEDFLAVTPTMTLNTLYRFMQPFVSRYTPRSDLSTEDMLIYDDVLAGNVRELVQYCERGEIKAQHVAEVICYYIDWVPRRQVQVIENGRAVSVPLVETVPVSKVIELTTNKHSD